MDKDLKIKPMGMVGNGCTSKESAAQPTIATSRLVRTWIILLPLLYYANSGLPGGSDAVSTPNSSRIHQSALLVVSVICTTFIVKNLSVVLSASLRMKLTLSLPLLALLSCAWSVDPRQSIVSGITLLCFTLFAIYLTETFTTDGQLDLVMLTGVIAVPTSIALALLVPSVGATAAGWRGIFAHKQQCGAAVTMFLITAIHWKPKHSLQKSLLPLYVVSCIVLIIMSQSRTGWLLALLALTLSASLWLLQKFAPKDSLFLVLMAIPVVGGLIYELSLLATLILSGIGKDPTLDERTVIWAAVWDAIGQKPILGYGYQAFWHGLQGASKTVVLIAGWNLYQAQSGYLDLWLQLGVLGVIALTLMTLAAGRNALRSFRHGSNAAFIRWCIVVIFCNLFYNIGESDFGYLRILWMLFVLAYIGLQKESMQIN